MNNDMELSDWIYFLLLLSFILFISCNMVHCQCKAEKLEAQLRELKEECVLKGVATYTFDSKGNITFKVLE